MRALESDRRGGAAWDAVVQRRRLRAELRRAREQAGLTQQQVAQAMDWSLSKVIRIESGVVGISTSDLKALLQLVGVHDEATVARCVEMARAGWQPAWCSGYRDVASPQLLSLVGYETAAATIHQFAPLVIPGLLQDETYTRALLTAQRVAMSAPELQRRVELHARRQRKLFGRDDPPEMAFILDEAALHRQVGGEEVMRRQFDRLRELADRDRVTVEVLPYSAGAPLIGGAFAILQFPNPDDGPLVFVEDPRGDLIRCEHQEDAGVYRQTFAQLRRLAGKAPLGELLDQIVRQPRRGVAGGRVSA